MIYTTVHRPTLTDEERAKRTEDIKLAAVNLVIAAEKNRKAQQAERKERT